MKRDYNIYTCNVVKIDITPFPGMSISKPHNNEAQYSPKCTYMYIGISRTIKCTWWLHVVWIATFQVHVIIWQCTFGSLSYMRSHILYTSCTLYTYIVHVYITCITCGMYTYLYACVHALITLCLWYQQVGTVYAHETGQARFQGVGEGGLSEWVLLYL